jgi:hypothetical protein
MEVDAIPNAVEWRKVRSGYLNSSKKSLYSLQNTILSRSKRKT